MREQDCICEQVTVVWGKPPRTREQPMASIQRCLQLQPRLHKTWQRGGRVAGERAGTEGWGMDGLNHSLLANGSYLISFLKRPAVTFTSSPH